MVKTVRTTLEFQTIVMDVEVLVNVAGRTPSDCIVSAKCVSFSDGYGTVHRSDLGLCTGATDAMALLACTSPSGINKVLNRAGCRDVAM